MNEHVSAWLEAYHDGELHGRRLQQVESHLADCTACRAELDTLRTLSVLLQAAPAPENLTPPERFVAQVGLQLPREQKQPVWWHAARAGWRLAPVGLFGAWAGLQAVFIVAGAVLFALRWGGEPALHSAAWLNRLSAGLVDVSPVALAPIGLDGLFPLGWGALIYLGMMALIGVLYLSWLASWWARQHQNLAKASSTLDDTRR